MAGAGKAMDHQAMETAGRPGADPMPSYASPASHGEGTRQEGLLVVPCGRLAEKDGTPAPVIRFLYY